MLLLHAAETAAAGDAAETAAAAHAAAGVAAAAETAATVVASVTAAGGPAQKCIFKKSCVPCCLPFLGCKGKNCKINTKCLVLLLIFK